MSKRPDDACRALAAEQYGHISREQARAHGISRRMLRDRLRNGQWDEIHANVFRLGPAVETYRERVVAAILTAPGSVAFGRTAANLWGIGGFPAQELEVVTTRSNPPRPPGVIVHRTTYLPDDDVQVRAGINVTSPSRTLLDLGGVMGRRAVQRAIDDALNKKLVTPELLRDQLARAGRMGRPGTRTFRSCVEVLAMEEALTESELENRLLEVLESAGWPRPKLQFEIWDGGLFLARVDAAYPDLRIAIEADGYAFHSALPDFARDRSRQNALTSRRWRVLRFTAEDALRPRKFLSDLERAAKPEIGA
jgi:hypothetical protein